MRRSRKFALFVFACSGILLATLVTAVLAAHLMANRELVRSYLIKKVDQATGGELDYDRLTIRLFPVPHILVRDINLDRKERFNLTARALSVYPRILPMLKGQIRLRRLVLKNPEIAFQMVATPGPSSNRSTDPTIGLSAEPVKNYLQRFFSGLAAIDPQSEFKIVSGRLLFKINGTEALHVAGLDTLLERDKESLSMSASCSSNFGDKFRLKATANLAKLQARGRLAGTNVNLRPLIPLISLPDGIRTADTQAQGAMVFTVNGPENMHGRVDLSFPSLTAMRKDRHLNVDDLDLSGTIEFSPKGFSVALERFQAKKPALDLTAAATLFFQGNQTHPVAELHAAATRLDVAIAGSVAGAITGDLDAIKTAFSVAKQGILTDVRFSAAFESSKNEFHCVKKKASGHLSKGRVTIPGIWADIEKLEGDVVYEDSHVAFKQVRGDFKGAEFQKLDAAIDWKNEPLLFIASPSVDLDVKTFYDWLLSFEKIAAVSNDIASITGTGRLTSLTIKGPLAEPENWAFKIVGSPENVTFHSPRIPFEISFSGGEITTIPDREQATGVKIDFLDGSFVTSYRSNRINGVPSTSIHADGTLGQETLDWLSTILPIPEHLQIKPPVELSKVHLLTDFLHSFTLSGKIKTAGGVGVIADLSRTPDMLQIRKLQFSDGRSKAAIAATLMNSILDLSFSGNIESQTANRLLRENRSLVGYLKGDFRTLIDLHAPLQSTFTGNLQGEGVRVHKLLSEPFVVDRFSVEGNGRRLTLQPSRFSVLDSELDVRGRLAKDYRGINFDLGVKADLIDQALINELTSIGKNKKRSDEKQEAKAPLPFEGTVRLNTTDFSYGGFTWTPVAAQIRVENDRLSIQIDKAGLCGISTAGNLTFSPDGVQMQLSPTASGASLQETVNCLGYEMDAAEVYYDLSGEINLPLVKENPALFLYGQVELTSENGRIFYSNVLMKIFSILNFSQLFAGGHSDLKDKGYGYSKALVKAKLGGGKLVLDEILVDGYSLKLTGNGTVDLTDAELDVILLATPFKTVDRVVKNLPLLGYITGGTLLTIPVHVEGPIKDLNVVPIPPSEVGKGLLGLMERTLKAPFKMVEELSDLSSKNAHNKNGSPGFTPPVNEH